LSFDFAQDGELVEPFEILDLGFRISRGFSGLILHFAVSPILKMQKFKVFSHFNYIAQIRRIILTSCQYWF
jgi:hypothetical protein